MLSSANTIITTQTHHQKIKTNHNSIWQNTGKLLNEN